MKLRLSKTLLVALVAVYATEAAHAKGVYHPGQILDSSGTTSISSINEGAVTTVFAPSVKDGDGQLKVNVTGDSGNVVSAPIFSRGGVLSFVGEGKDKTSMSITPNSTGVIEGHAGAVLSAAGKNWTDANGTTQYATFSIKDITLSTNSHHAITVGGADGNGHLLIDNSVVDNSKGTSLFIGYYSNRGNAHDNVGGSANGSGTYETPDCEKTEENRFYGDYETYNGKEFGRGVVTVTNNSTYNTGVSSLSIGHGELNIDNSSHVTTGHYRNIIGLKIGGKATVMIDNGSSWTVGSTDVSNDDNYLAIGHGDKTEGTVKVSNNSTLVSNGVTYVAAHTFEGEETSTMSGTLTLTGTSTAKLNQVYVGNTLNGSGYISVESGSSIVAADGASDGFIQVNSKGELVNSGSISLGITLNGGQLTANSGSSFASISAASGTIIIDGSMQVSGDMLLGTHVMALADTVEESSSLTIIYKNGTIDLAGNNLTVGSGVTVQLAEGVEVQDELALFTNVANADALSEISISVLSADGTALDNVKVTASIPEPATATLSLLALAALAARRRRY